LITRDTVIGDTPALDATSFTVGFSGVPLMALIPAVSHYLGAMSALAKRNEFRHFIYIAPWTSAGRMSSTCWRTRIVGRTLSMDDLGVDPLLTADRKSIS
jgi:hypothetical protein